MSHVRSTARGPMAVLCLLMVLGSCDDPTAGTNPGEAAVADARGGPFGQKTEDGGRNVVRYYGIPVRVGNGLARTYVLVDRASREHPLEIGVALSEKALDGLPAAPATAAMAMSGHHTQNMQLLELPEQNPTPYEFVELDWNPAGHEPAGVYDLPHFDFHFYTVPVATRNAILPTDPDFAAKAANLPLEDFRPPFYLDGATAAGAPAAAVTVPQMGLHWVDVRSPELQGLEGNPAGFQPFTKTFLIGSWDGRFIFDEPMITRAYLLAKEGSTDAAVQDEIIPVPTARRYAPAGFYPSAYRVAYDAHAHEFLVALTLLVQRD